MLFRSERHVAWRLCTNGRDHFFRRGKYRPHRRGLFYPAICFLCLLFLFFLARALPLSLLSLPDEDIPNGYPVVWVPGARDDYSPIVNRLAKPIKEGPRRRLLSKLFIVGCSFHICNPSRLRTRDPAPYIRAGRATEQRHAHQNLQTPTRRTLAGSL